MSLSCILAGTAFAASTTEQPLTPKKIIDTSVQDPIDAEKMAQTMYQLWLGAALLARLARNKQPLYLALETTQQLLQPIKE